MKTLLRWVVLWILAVVGTTVVADSLEVINLQNRSSAEIIPLVRPLLNPDEAVSGTGFQLILRAAPARRAEIKAVIAQLDQAAQQLRISVRRASHEQIEQERVQAQVAVGAGGGTVEARGRAIVRSTDDKLGENNFYQVTALENTPAFIHTGEAFPTPTQTGQIVGGQVIVTQGLEYQQVSSGFYALARTQGERVIVNISPQREVLDPRGGGRIQTTSLVTTVQGRLGDWLELGGTAEQREHQGGGLLRSTRSRSDAQQTLWLKVDRLD